MIADWDMASCLFACSGFNYQSQALVGHEPFEDPFLQVSEKRIVAQAHKLIHGHLEQVEFPPQFETAQPDSGGPSRRFWSVKRIVEGKGKGRVGQGVDPGRPAAPARRRGLPARYV